MKLLILGAYDSCNLGDGVICQCVAERLKQRFPHAQVEIRDLLQRDRRAPRRIPEPKALKKRWFYEKARSVASRAGWDRVARSEMARVETYRDYIDSVCAMDCDGVVFAGGQLFMDRYALFLERYVQAFSAKNVPIFFHACGVGPMDSQTIRPRFVNALGSSAVKQISCRDHREKISRLLGGADVPFAADLALRTAQVYGIQPQRTDVIGLGMMYPWGMPVGRVVAFWRKLIRELDGQHLPWKIFTNGDPADIAFAQMVLENTRQEQILPRDTEPEGLVRTISGFGSIISFRLHSHIIAASLDIPSVAMVWDEKLPVFFEKLGCRERCMGVGESPKAVLEMLEKAQREGYDRERILALADASEALLVNGLEGCL